MDKIKYESLNSKQKETYNYHKVSAVLADYGYFTMRVTDDWESADFIAMNCIDKSFIKVQLKGRLTFSKKYKDKDLYITFEDKKTHIWYLYPHDILLNKLYENTNRELAWDKNGDYSFPSLSKLSNEILEQYKLK
jgi:hypothetical protein